MSGIRGGGAGEGAGEVPGERRRRGWGWAKAHDEKGECSKQATRLGVGVAALDDEALDDAVERLTVEVARVGELLEVFHRLGSYLRKGQGVDKCNCLA